MRSVRARGAVTLAAALSLALSAGPAHALACLVDEAAEPPPVPGEAPCHPPAHDEAPAQDDAPASPEAPGPTGPSMNCCLVPAGVMRAVPTDAVSSAAVLAGTVEHALAPRLADVGVRRAYRPPAPPGRLHLLHGCFLT